MLTAGLSREKVFEMVVVEDLKTAVNDPCQVGYQITSSCLTLSPVAFTRLENLSAAALDYILDGEFFMI